jgi:putative SOS response-associated peptidase YedK
MPVMVPPGGWNVWLDPDTAGGELWSLLKTPPGELDIWPLDRRISNIRNDNPALLLTTGH